MRISDWSSDVCSSDLLYALSGARAFHHVYGGTYTPWQITDFLMLNRLFPRSVAFCADQLAYRLNRLAGWHDSRGPRSEEHTSELQSLMRISYAVFCLKKKKNDLMITKYIVST